MPDNFWKTASEWWIKQDEKYAKNGTNKPSEDYIVREVAGFDSVLEIGAGTGRLIGLLSQKDIDCHSVDICLELCNLVKSKYPKVNTHNLPADKLYDFEDNSIDLVYTFQCLQHIDNKTIDKALKEIFRVAKKEVWLIEGYTPGRFQGEKTCRGYGDSYVYYFDQMFKCYHIDNVQDRKILAYRIRKDENAQNHLCCG